jgi:hypothetical protein
VSVTEIASEMIEEETARLETEIEAEKLALGQ